MSQRIEKLKEGINPEKYPISTRKAQIVRQSFEETEGIPRFIRLARVQADVLDKMPIFIEDGELIVGNGASKPMGVEVSHVISNWSQKEIDGLKEEGYVISAEDEAEIEPLREYWDNKTFADRCAQLFDKERQWPYQQSGVVIPPWEPGEAKWGGAWAGSGMGITMESGLLVLLDFAKVLNGGLNQIIEEAEEELRNTRIMAPGSVEKVDFLRAVIIVHKAIIRFANRFAVLAADMTAKEKDQVRKKELERIAEVCQWVPANPARGFYEAIQSFWFIFLTLNPSLTHPIGRFDQYMYRFYKKDIDQGKITDEEVLELLQCLRLKDMQMIVTAGRSQREKWSGMARWHNMIIGGQTPDGEDATNELTYLILEAAKRCQTPHHTITMRVHEGTPEALMLKALEVVKTGIGMPAFIGDGSCIEYLLCEGVPLRLARDYGLAGCLDVNLPGRSRISAYMMFIVPLVFDIFMHNGVEPRTGKQLGPKTGDLESFETFDELMKAWKEHLTHFMGLQAEWNNITIEVQHEQYPRLIDSSLMVNGIKEGRDICGRTTFFENGSVLNCVGMINVVDSLAAIKKLVFDEKKITMKELKAALDANWQGNGYEELRQICLAAPKYGNDDDYADSIARELYKFWADIATTFDTTLGGKHKPSGISISAQWPGGVLTGATPDGRYAGECLADGSMSPMRGRDTHGPTAVIKSALKIDQVLYQSTLLNMKFHPTALNSTRDLSKLSDLIRIYFRMGGKHIQFNVVGRDTLLAAQKRPEEYRDLIVRIAGYSAYFIQLSKTMQDEIIARSDHRLT